MLFGFEVAINRCSHSVPEIVFTGDQHLFASFLKALDMLDSILQ